MKLQSFDTWQRLTVEALEDPKPRMYFHEMFAPIALVLSVEGDIVVWKDLCDKITKTTPRSEFKARFLYGGKSEVAHLPWILLGGVHGAWACTEGNVPHDRLYPPVLAPDPAKNRTTFANWYSYQVEYA